MNYDRLIIEMMSRVSALEEEVQKLKEDVDNQSAEGNSEKMVTSNTGRDKTKYLMDNKKYPKNRLVLAIVQKYVKENPNITANNLISTFDKTLQGSLGVVRKLDDAKESYTDYERRFFTDKDEIITTLTEDCVVCTQWGKDNIGNIVARAEKLGIAVTPIQ